ncbi:MAG: hypothetical protein OEV40_24365, partial [Acidimicrobiia bacterium]|nr:hypothetical protein [Acidimicrobiia bacterium]
SNRRTGWATLNGAGLLAAFSLVAAGCAPSADRPHLADEPVSPAVLAAGSAGDLGVTANSPLPPTPPSTVPADLEDFVRAPAPPSTPSAAPFHRRASPPSASAEGEAVTRLAPTRAGTASADGTSGIAAGGSSGEPSPLAAALPDGIDGFEAIAGPEADRYLDLRAAAGIQPDPTEEIALLETRGFRGGWTRAFRSETNDVAVVSVYEFENPAQAEFYLEDGLITIGGYGGSFFDIEGLPGVRGFAQAFTDGDEELISLGASFQAGPRWFLVYLVGSSETVTPEILIPVIAEQQGRHVAAASAG